MTTATAAETSWPVAGLFLDALTRRDFTALANCLDPAVRMRALVPPGPFELNGPDDVVAKFRMWFDKPGHFEVLDASIGVVGARTYLRWRIQSQSRFCEQHVYVNADNHFRAFDLLCSGFQEGVSS